MSRFGRVLILSSLTPAVMAQTTAVLTLDQLKPYVGMVCEKHGIGQYNASNWDTFVMVNGVIAVDHNYSTRYEKRHRPAAPLPVTAGNDGWFHFQSDSGI